ncbi:MAG: hypothetical protein KBD39_11170 [Sterolibacterium sp.]|nr:hypothetical protein [Sterolibacterium sp.]MBP9800663.1 hypothetical protein [Sterolibacterium sp.]
MPETNAAMAVLEQVLEIAYDGAISARDAGNKEKLEAFFEVLDWAKMQAEVMNLPKFSNNTLNELDPYTLLSGKKKAA